jgi:uncharacterized membrane protein
MRTVRRSVHVELPPEQAFDLWVDTARWPMFIDGFSIVESADGDWPAEGAELVWRSTPAGRGRVSEKVIASERPVVLTTQVLEETLTAKQTVSFEPVEEGGSAVGLEFEYVLTTGGPLRFLTDVFFIRRAESDALARTLSRFATEAAEEAAL